MIKLLILLYSLTAIVDFVGYLPTIKDLWINKKQTANFQSYLLWTATNIITFCYGLFVLKDIPFLLVTGTWLLANFTILILTFNLERKKLNFKKIFEKFKNR